MTSSVEGLPWYDSSFSYFYPRQSAVYLQPTISPRIVTRLASAVGSPSIDSSPTHEDSSFERQPRPDVDGLNWCRPLSQPSSTIVAMQQASLPSALASLITLRSALLTHEASSVVDIASR